MNNLRESSHKQHTCLFGNSLIRLLCHISKYQEVEIALRSYGNNNLHKINCLVKQNKCLRLWFKLLNFCFSCVCHLNKTLFVILGTTCIVIIKYQHCKLNFNHFERFCISFHTIQPVPSNFSHFFSYHEHRNRLRTEVANISSKKNLNFNGALNTFSLQKVVEIIGLLESCYLCRKCQFRSIPLLILYSFGTVAVDNKLISF